VHELLGTGAGYLADEDSRMQPEKCPCSWGGYGSLGEKYPIGWGLMIRLRLAFVAAVVYNSTLAGQSVPARFFYCSAAT
jgi:hypothetical protein